MRGIPLLSLLAVGACASGGSAGAPGMAEGRLTPCPDSPNCVVSEPGADEKHAIKAFPLAAWERLPQVVAAEGGEIVQQSDGYIAAVFTTKIMRYKDDVEFRLDDAAVHVRSASRVGYSDLGANRKRIESLRALLVE